MSNFWRPVVAFTKVNLLRFFRDKMYIFFMFILPVMFLVIFGFMYKNDMSSFEVVIFDEAQTELTAEVTAALSDEEEGVVKQVEVADRAEAEERMTRGELSAIVTFPAEFGAPNAAGLPSGEVEVLYSKNSEQAGQILTSVLASIMSSLDREISGTAPIFTVKPEVAMHDGLTTFDYVFAGLLGYTVMSVGMLGIANIIPGDKKTRAIRRLHATTLTKTQLILAYSATFLLVGVLVFAVMIGLGLLLFDFQMRGSWLNFLVFLVAAVVMMLGFGLAIGGGAKNDMQASAAANLVMFPMMFLSGVFFPMFMMPEFIQRISEFIPLTPVVDGIRLIITENYSLLQVLPQLAMVGVWGMIVYIVAIRIFKWE